MTKPRTKNITKPTVVTETEEVDLLMENVDVGNRVRKNVCKLILETEVTIYIYKKKETSTFGID